MGGQCVPTTPPGAPSDFLKELKPSHLFFFSEPMGACDGIAMCAMDAVLAVA